MTEISPENPLLQVEKEKVCTRKISIVTLHSSDSDIDLSEEVSVKFRVNSDTKVGADHDNSYKDILSFVKKTLFHL